LAEWYVTACPECGIDESALDVADAVNAVRTFPRRYREALDVDDALLTVRPDPSTWSMLEYAVHYREVLELLATGLSEVLARPDVHFPPVDADETAGARPSWTLDRELALDGIAHGAEQLVARSESTPVAAWDREFTIGDHHYQARWIPQHAAHEGAHHLRDIEQVRRAVSGDR
jgi:hypothetical protein